MNPVERNARIGSGVQFYKVRRSGEYGLVLEFNQDEVRQFEEMLPAYGAGCDLTIRAKLSGGSALVTSSDKVLSEAAVSEYDIRYAVVSIAGELGFEIDS